MLGWFLMNTKVYSYYSENCLQPTENLAASIHGICACNTRHHLHTDQNCVVHTLMKWTQEQRALWHHSAARTPPPAICVPWSRSHLTTLSLSLPTRNANPWSLLCSGCEDYCENGKKKLNQSEIVKAKVLFVTFKSLESSWMFFLACLATLVSHTPLESLSSPLVSWSVLLSFMAVLFCVFVCAPIHIYI